MEYINWFLNVKATLHTWNKSHLVALYNSFNIFYNSIRHIFWRITGPIFMRNIGLLLCFLICPLSGVGIRVMLDSYNELGMAFIFDSPLPLL